MAYTIFNTENMSSPRSHLNSQLLRHCVDSNRTQHLTVFLDSSVRKKYKDLVVCCAVTECITNKEAGDISLHAPAKKLVDKWSEILGVHLTVTSLVCERHFRSCDQKEYSLNLLPNRRYVKRLPNLLPVAINEGSTCNVTDTSLTVDLTVIDDSSEDSQRKHEAKNKTIKSFKKKIAKKKEIVINIKKALPSQKKRQLQLNLKF